MLPVGTPDTASDVCIQATGFENTKLKFYFLIQLRAL